MTTTQDISQSANAVVSSSLQAAPEKGPAHTITLIPGEGVGPEVISAAVRAVEATGVEVSWEKVSFDAASIATCDVGLPPSLIEAIRKNRVTLKGPMTTAVPESLSCVNSALRRRLGLFANFRPIRSFPGSQTQSSGQGMDIALFQENAEGLYAGVGQLMALGLLEEKDLIARTISFRIADVAFSFARREGKQRVTAIHKGYGREEQLFLECCHKTAKSFRDLQYEELLATEVAEHLRRRAHKFEVVVSPSHFGRSLADLCSFMVGGSGLLPYADLGETYAVFSAPEESSPKNAGRNFANPSGCIRAAALLLRHIGESEAAFKLERGVDSVYAGGKHLTSDLGGKATTAEFTEAVIGELDR